MKTATGVLFAILFLFPAIVSAQYDQTIACADNLEDLEEAWQCYEDIGGVLDILYPLINGSSEESTTGLRRRQEAIAPILQMVTVSEYLIEHDRTLVRDEVESLIDASLTLRQHVGSYRVELGLYVEGLGTFVALLNDERLEERIALKTVVLRNYDEALEGYLREFSTPLAEQVALRAEQVASAIIEDPQVALPPVIDVNVDLGPEQTRRSLALPVTTTIVGLAGVGIGLKFYSMTASDVEQYKRLVSACIVSGEDCAHISNSPLADSIHQNQTNTIACLSVGGALALTGGVWTVIRVVRNSQGRGSHVFIEPSVTYQGDERFVGATLRVGGW